MTLEVRDVRYLVSCDGEDQVAERVNVLVEDGVIRAIGKKRHETDAWIDAGRMVMYPGLVNTQEPSRGAESGTFSLAKVFV